MGEGNTRVIFFTDLDGTFLDHDTYSFADSLPALRLAVSGGSPVVFCSSKTRAEIEPVRDRLRLADPFIVENGGAVYVPGGHFGFDIGASRFRDGYDVIELGTPYETLVQRFRKIREALPFSLIGFSDMPAEEVSEDCGLSLSEAQRAKQREYDEPFRILRAAAADIPQVLRKFQEAGLRVETGGRYHHLHGRNDKGLAVRILSDLYRRADRSVFTVGLGDSLNDVPMLENVDLPILVKKPDGGYDPAVLERLPQVRRADGVGPCGWAAAIMEILGEQGSAGNPEAS
jgi:mannosyl-3-phosphoglycerate phosphatase